MKYKTRLLAERFTEMLKSWPGVECITINEASLSDTTDPYYALILDVFYFDSVPQAQDRFKLYGDDVAAFESSRHGEKDRFLIGGLPVRLEFKPVEKTEELLTIAEAKHGSLWLISDSGTYSFYRLANGDIAFSRSGWMLETRKRLEALPAVFWEQMRSAVQAKMEHFLSDLGAACFKEDKFHYLVASAGFIKAACLTLFCINRRFEPSHRAYFKRACELPVLPETFEGEFEAFLEDSHGGDMEMRFLLAKLIAKKIVML